jgi:hypothetical protein
MIRSEVAQLYTPIYDEFMLAEYKEYSQVSPKVFKSIDDSTKEYKVDDISGLGVCESAEEGAGGGYEDPTLGYPKTYTQGKFWKKFQVTFEAVDQDEYALLNKEGNARSMGRGSRAKVETDTSAVFNDGFATAGPDGEYLFDTDHPRNREQTDADLDSDNLLSGPFSHDSLELAEKQMADALVDPAGIPMAYSENPIILHPPALKGTVARVLSDRADLRPGSEMNDINRFAGRYTPVEWIYLSKKQGGSDTAWYIVFPELGFFKIIWNAKPHFVSWVDEENEFYKFKGRMLYACGVDNWRGAFGSTGL